MTTIEIAESLLAKYESELIRGYTQFSNFYDECDEEGILFDLDPGKMSNKELEEALSTLTNLKEMEDGIADLIARIVELREQIQVLRELDDGQ